MTNVLLACSQLAWTIATGSVAGYDVEIDSAIHQVPGPSSEACLPVANQPHQIRVRGFDAAGVRGPWSDALTLQWVDIKAVRGPIALP